MKKPSSPITQRGQYELACRIAQRSRYFQDTAMARALVAAAVRFAETNKSLLTPRF